MEFKEIMVFSEESNYGVVQMPGRRLPGSVVQGDSLAILCGLARSIYAELADQGEIADDAAELLELLEARQKHYEHVLAEHQIQLPYLKAP